MRTKRSGFTLLELLVVIVTISILALIGLQAAGAAIEAAREAATRSTLFRLKVQAARRAETLQRWQRLSPATVYESIEYQLVSQKFPALGPDVKSVLAKKLMLAHALPQDSSEMWDAKMYPPGFTTVEFALLGDSGWGDRTADDSVKMTDAWGNPIVFLRWPTRLFAAHPELLPGPCSHDPDDPLNQLQGLFTAGTPFDTLLPIQMPDPCKCYVSLFVSAGPDGKLGLTLPLGEVTSEDDLADNLWSIRQ